MRDFILSEIKRLAAESGGVAPGQQSFAKATGITHSKWRGVYWLGWSDALADAGFAANKWNEKSDSGEILRQITAFCVELKRLPTRTEIRFQRRVDPSFPTHTTIFRHFRSNAELVAALRTLGAEDENWSKLHDYLPENAGEERENRSGKVQEGMVYLLKSGKHYKIGRSDDIERRFREVTIALPESVTLVHTIRTDDPSGIEAYWHRRFADKRANGEWFALTGDDVRAFCKRTFQ